MQVLVNQENLNNVVATLKTQSRLAIDTETTGLEPFKGDRVFSVIIADESNEYYFNFNIGGLHRASTMPLLQEIISAASHLFFINYDYDSTMLHFENINFIKPTILDGGVMARLENSLHDPSGRKSENQFFSMDYLAKYYLSLEKDSTVVNHIKQNDLYGLDSKGKKKPLYNKVPLDIMFKYGCSDARITFDVCTEIIKRINGRDKFYLASRPKNWPNIMSLLANEAKLSKALADTKLRGLLLDKEYCIKARAYELENAAALLAEIKKTVNLNVNSPKQVQNYLMGELGLTLPKIIKRGKWTGGHSTDAGTLEALAEKHDLPVLNKIVGAKRSQKKANTYYKNYIEMVDDNNLIHCGLGQETTTTGRLSSFNPNLQNLSKENYHEYAVRNSFICPPDFDFFFLDYSAQEMIIAIDLAGDQEIIEKVKAKTDVYIAMLEMVEKFTGIKITRSQAKALALGVLYGQGIALIASNLKCSETEAKKLRDAFKSSLKGVTELDNWCKTQAKRYGRVHNPFGRVSLIEKDYGYKTLNALVQGTAADTSKTAFVNCFEFLQDYKSSVTLCVHDELLFYIHKDERGLIPDLQRIMSEAYPHRYLPLKTDVEWSQTSWGAKIKYDPTV